MHSCGLLSVSLRIQSLRILIMEISKVLTVDSPVHLYRVLDSRNELVDHSSGDLSIKIRHYVDVASEYLYGCKCDEENNWIRLQSEYEIISKDSEFSDHLCHWLACDRIDFK